MTPRGPARSNLNRRSLEVRVVLGYFVSRIILVLVSTAMRLAKLQGDYYTELNAEIRGSR